MLVTDLCLPYKTDRQMDGQAGRQTSRYNSFDLHKQGREADRKTGRVMRLNCPDFPEDCSAVKFLVAVRQGPP